MVPVDVWLFVVATLHQLIKLTVLDNHRCSSPAAIQFFDKIQTTYFNSVKTQTHRRNTNLPPRKANTFISQPCKHCRLKNLDRKAIDNISQPFVYHNNKSKPHEQFKDTHRSFAPQFSIMPLQKQRLSQYVLQIHFTITVVMALRFAKSTIIELLLMEMCVAG